MSTKNTTKLIALIWLMLLAVTTILPPIASAQFVEALQSTNTPSPPPPGDGPIPLPVESGDGGQPLRPPSGQADDTNGSMFPAGTGYDRTIVRIYRHTGGAQGKDRGNRIVQTLRPDQLSQDQINKINTILGINMLSGEQSIDISATDSQIEQVQAALASYPQYQMIKAHKRINQDTPGTGYPKTGRDSLFKFKVPPPGQQNSTKYNSLPTVKSFSRYLVILGVVSATIWMALAATSVVMGHPYGGARVVSAVAGLMLLLMAYTIWKIVQMNTINSYASIHGQPDVYNTDTPAGNQGRPQQAQVSDAYIQPSTVPLPPESVRPGPERFGVPLEPLGNTGNN
ncbi:MAG: hypothetical protein HY711_07670 [Candidatus Melainabacteria bacterium]|nr:hypothetical protein [Candidatus Melainabacteria bacterium]